MTNAIPVPPGRGKLLLGHPRGLTVCFFTEMWERFSYYGMRGLLIFYLTQHFLFSDETAAGIYGAYISLVYITPVIGGIISDRYLGPGRCVMLGAVLLVAGHFGMALEGPAAVEVTVQGETFVQRSVGSLQLFYVSLGLIITGTGFLKTNISSLVGSLYEPGDVRRDGGFTLFYMGVNTGALLGPLVCGYLLETRGFGWGFGAAGIGMLAGLLVFVRGRKLLPAAMTLPETARLRDRAMPGISRQWLIYILTFVCIFVVAWLLQNRALVGGLLSLSLTVMVAIVIGYALKQCGKVERDRMLLCLFLMSYQVLFWSLFEQTGSSLNLMADRNVDRVVSGFEIPVVWFQSVNAFFIITLAPLFSFGWTWLARHGWEPSTPTKFALALIQLGLGFLVLVFGASFAESPTQVAVIWLVLLYLFHTTGELCLSPVGLSMTTKLSPAKVVGMMMGCWFLAMAAGNFVSGIIAAMTGAATVAGEVADPAAALANYTDIYLSAGLYSVMAGTAALALAPFLKRFLHDVN
ncbi:MAG: peptide MFS transporter [Pseudohongiellaceae bacterium]